MKTQKNRLSLAGSLLAMVFAMPYSTPLMAEALNDPFVSANRNPFVQVYGLPTAESAQLQAVGQWSSGLQLEVSNNFTEASDSDELVFIDGESYRANLQLRYGLSEQWELGVDIPYLKHSGGELDGFIEDWHDTFGFPDGDRLDYAQDQLLYAYQNSSGDRVSMDSADNGLGDISLSLGYQLYQDSQRQWALRTAIKLPTGDADSLLGSESTDLALALNVTDSGVLAAQNITLHGSAGVLFMDGGEVLGNLREDWVAFASGTLSWQYSSNLSLKLQLDAHSAFYNSDTTELGDASAQLIMGGALRLNEQWVLDLAVSEDVAVDTAPDVLFHIGLKKGF